MKNQRTEHPVGEIRLMQALKQRTQRDKLNLTGARGALWCHIRKTFLDVDQRQEAGDKIQNKSKTDEGIKNLTKHANRDWFGKLWNQAAAVGSVSTVGPGLDFCDIPIKSFQSPKEKRPTGDL